jgi:hypothetical protein
MVDYTTTLTNAVNRVVDRVIDGIAAEGLRVLNRILVKSGFLESEYLKNFELSAGVSGNTIHYYIALEAETVDITDEEREEFLKELEKTKSIYKVTQQAMRYYKLEKGNVIKIGDARTTSSDRLAAHEVALNATRGARVTATGKLFVTLRRTIGKTDTRRYRYPKRESEGIPKEFIEKFKTTIAEEFSEELRNIIRRYIL